MMTTTTQNQTDNLTSSHRFDFIDLLRGIGASAVFMAHAGSVLPLFHPLLTNNFQFGQFGVLVFLLCSGFIVPVSLERNGSLCAFWIKRFFRLYPIYWISLIAATGLYAIVFGFPRAFGEHPWLTVAANATMFQMFLGLPNVINLYYTLAIEMIFYRQISQRLYNK